MGEPVFGIIDLLSGNFLAWTTTRAEAEAVMGEWVEEAEGAALEFAIAEFDADGNIV